MAMALLLYTLTFIAICVLRSRLHGDSLSRCIWRRAILSVMLLLGMLSLPSAIRVSKYLVPMSMYQEVARRWESSDGTTRIDAVTPSSYPVYVPPIWVIIHGPSQYRYSKMFLIHHKNTNAYLTKYILYTSSDNDTSINDSIDAEEERKLSHNAIYKWATANNLNVPNYVIHDIYSMSVNNNMSTSWNDWLNAPSKLQAWLRKEQVLSFSMSSQSLWTSNIYELLDQRDDIVLCAIPVIIYYFLTYILLCKLVRTSKKRVR